jgi:hypothetical protein
MEKKRQFITGGRKSILLEDSQAMSTRPTHKDRRAASNKSF